MIDGSTRILGLIADPVAQARSPMMVNERLLQQERLGAYVLVPMHVPASDLAAFVAGLRGLGNFDGAIVSMPHKTTMAALVDELTPEAARVGAVNVIRRNERGRLIGTMLDGEGFVAGLAGTGYSVEGKRILLAGAGGAASAVAFALAAHGCASLALRNRTRAKAEGLAARLLEHFPTVEVTTQETRDPVDVLVNGTSLGMRGGDALPFSVDLVDRATLVAECVVAPEMTPLLDLAGSRGKRIHTGLPMLAAQIGLMVEFMT